MLFATLFEIFHRKSSTNQLFCATEKHWFWSSIKIEIILKFKNSPLDKIRLHAHPTFEFPFSKLTKNLNLYTDKFKKYSLNDHPVKHLKLDS